MLSSHLKSICFLAFSGIWWTRNVFGDATWGLLSNVEKHGEINGCRKKKTWTSNRPNTFLCVRIWRLLTHFEETFDSFPSQKLQPFQVLNLLRFATAPACASFSPPPLGSRTGVFSQHPVLQQAVSWNVVSSRSMLLNIPNNRRKIGWMLVYHWVCQNSSLQFLAKHSPCLAHRTISAFQFFCLWLA